MTLRERRDHWRLEFFRLSKEEQTIETRKFRFLARKNWYRAERDMREFRNKGRSLSAYKVMKDPNKTNCYLEGDCELHLPEQAGSF